MWRSVQRANVPKDVITVPTFLHFSARHYLFWITVLAVGVFACAYVDCHGFRTRIATCYPYL